MTTIYTKTGDDGTTGRLFGGRVAKDNTLVDACGDIDEAVAALGVARQALDEAADDSPSDGGGEAADLSARVLQVQRQLFVIAADLMANPRARARLVPGISLAGPELTDGLERAIDELVERRPLRPVFVVPGTTRASAALDLARAVLRRAERHTIGARGQDQQVSDDVIAWLNRAGDLLYVLARHAVGDGEEPPSHA